MDEPKIEIKIDLEQMTFGDLETIDKAQSGEMKMADVIPFLDRIVVGGVRSLPITQMPAILKALTDGVQTMSNPESPSGN